LWILGKYLRTMGKS